MFHLDQDWHDDAATDSLNRSLFDHLPGQVSVKKVSKKLKRKPGKGDKSPKSVAEQPTVAWVTSKQQDHEKKLKKRKNTDSRKDVISKTLKLDSVLLANQPSATAGSSKMKTKKKKNTKKMSVAVEEESDINTISKAEHFDKDQVTSPVMQVIESVSSKRKIKKKKKLDKNLEKQDGVKNSEKVSSEETKSEKRTKKLPFAPGNLKAALENQKVSNKHVSLKNVNKDSQKLSHSNTPNRASDIEVNKPTKLSKKDMKNLSNRDRMKMKLNAARFRYLNEQLYTSSSQHALTMFKKDPEAFTVYHTGFQSQVECWPVNPVNQMIDYIKSRSPSLLVADFGCGNAKIARSVPNTVHSFDLVAVNKYVTVCDISRVPLTDHTMDIVVICLALMGNNWIQFLKEAARVLKIKGVLKIVEVSSRYEDVKQFVRVVEVLGFSLKKQDDSNKMFTSFEFLKTKNSSPNKLPDVKLLPCVYKKR